MAKQQHIGRLSAKEIEALKSEHKDVYEITVADDDGNVHHAYVKKPNLTVISGAARYAESDPVKSGMLMYKAVRLSGSDAIEQDDELKMSVIAQVGQIFKIREAELKKL